MSEKPSLARWHRRAESRPEEILQAALELLCERGFRATRLDDIAAKAGVTKPLIYHYYRDKDDLVHKALEWRLEQVLAGMREELEGLGGAWDDRLRNFCRWQWQRWCDPDWGRVHRIVVSEMRQEAPDLYRQWVRRAYGERCTVVQEILHGAKSRLKRGTDPVGASRFLVAGLWQMAVIHAHGEMVADAATLDALLETTLDIFIAGIRRTTEAG